jgi:hypothetical protein
LWPIEKKPSFPISTNRDGKYRVSLRKRYNNRWGAPTSSYSIIIMMIIIETTEKKNHVNLAATFVPEIIRSDPGKNGQLN